MYSLVDLIVTFLQRLGVFLPLYGALFLLQVAKFDLLHEDTLTTLTFALIWCVVILVSTMNLGWHAHVVPFLLLAWLTVAQVAPGVTGSITTIFRADERKLERAAQEYALDIPQRIECNAETAASLTLLVQDNETGQLIPQLWYTVRNDRIICWDRPGLDPHTGEELHVVSKYIAALIVAQPAETKNVPRTFSYQSAPRNRKPQQTFTSIPVQRR